MSTRHRFFLFGTLLALGALWYSFEETIPPNTFVLKEDGWHPRQLLIEPGETATFVNKSRNAFWPASNSHPAYEQYSAFDAGHPIASGESWSFVFTQKGQWGFHDHLRSFYTGMVIVGAEYETYDCSAHMKDFNLSQKRTCWGEQLLLELQEHGAASAFQLFAQFYDSDPDFAAVGCHLMAHQIGDYAYGEYLRQGKDISAFQFPAESTYCGYGYYHGILEHLIRDNPNFADADAFCKALIAKHEDELPRIRLNCYHALGHGFVPEPTEIAQWGNVEALTQPAIEACNQLSAGDARVECLQGIFNVIGDWMWHFEFGLAFNREDPFSVCRAFASEEVSDACYYEISMRVAPLVGDTLVNVYHSYVASIPDDYIAGTVIHSVAAGVIGQHITETTFTSYIQECHRLPVRVQKECVKGLAGGFVAHGEPGVEYVKAIAFCKDAELTLEERDICNENIIRTFKGAYPKEKVAVVCKEIELPYQKYCAYE